MDLESKIKTAAQVAELITSERHGKRVGMAHGCWDVVHYGHIRHLIYAKTQVDILIVSLTPDIFIEKGVHRPNVPQDLRAMNLAALSMVDFVIIDQNSTPIDNIKLLKPDLFAKGYEYKDAEMLKTAEEAAAVAAYGGQIIFTPGDVVYSSTTLLKVAPPTLRYEKLLEVMKREKVTFAALRDCLAGMAGFRVHVIGDTIVDSQTQTSMIGGQTKTPTMSVKYERREDFVGGAGIVAKHLRAAGARVDFSTVIGNDGFGRFVRRDLEDAGVVCNGIIDSSRPTTHKNAIICAGYRLLKVDDVDNRIISDNIVARLVDDMREIQSDAVVFSDFRHGIFNKRTIPTLIAGIKAPFRVADSQVASRWGNITEFQGFDLITPNEREARFATGDQDSGVSALALAVYKAAGCRSLMLKMGNRGMLACDGGNAEDGYLALDSFTKNEIDPVGAGDAMLAYATLAMLKSGKLAVASIIGSIAASLECERDGNVPITPKEVLERLNHIEGEASYAHA